MTIKVDGYEIKIEAKNVAGGSTKFNKEDTRMFLVTLACLAHDAKYYNQANGWEAIADENVRYAKAFDEAWRAIAGEVEK